MGGPPAARLLGPARGRGAHHAALKEMSQEGEPRRAAPSYRERSDGLIKKIQEGLIRDGRLEFQNVAGSDLLAFFREFSKLKAEEQDKYFDSKRQRAMFEDLKGGIVRRAYKAKYKRLVVYQHVAKEQALRDIK